MTANDLKLYHAAASPNSRRVRIFMAEERMTAPLETVDLSKGEQHSNAYCSINAKRGAQTGLGGW
jgi:glutathione S-transferase